VLAAFLTALAGAGPAHANPGLAVIEIDPRAETLMDPRALRRRVQLELADVTVPPLPGQTEAALFFRVLLLGASDLKIELWERGVAYGSRVVAAANDTGPLLARRVALAAAELARELSDTRDDEATERLEARAKQLTLERAARERTRDGPRALRASGTGVWSPKLVLAGPALASELHVYGKERLDLDAAASFGVLGSATPSEAYSIGLGPARRVGLGPRWDLDFGLRVAAWLLVMPRARGVDDIAGQHQTWTASVEGRVRVEPRVTRSVRLALGVGGGTLLRRVPYANACGANEHASGPFVAAEFSLVITPL
jgi:hypothetical protein